MFYMKEYGSIDVNKEHGKLPNIEKKELEDYLNYRKSRGLNSDTKIKDVSSGIVRLRVAAGKPLKKLDIKQVMHLASLIKSSSYGDYSKNEALTNLKRYVKWINPKMNVSALEDIRLVKKPVRKREINSNIIPTKEEIEKLVKHEPNMFWKAFIFTQYESGLRTKETRYLKWKDIEFDIDEDISEINIFSTKTKKQRTTYVKEATFYLKKLEEEQRNTETKGEYIFHSLSNINIPVNRAAISLHMTRLSKKVLGRNCWNYLLRHKRGNELYQLVKQGKISMDTALAFMGHSKEMSPVYTHDQKEEVKKMLREQIYHIEDLPPEKKADYEMRLANMEILVRKIIKKLGKKEMEELYEEVTGKKAKII